MRYRNLSPTSLTHLIVQFSVVAALATASWAAARVEVPIQQSAVSGNNAKGSRYWVWLSIGGEAPLKAMLDTGSAGLMVLANGLSEPDDLPGSGEVSSAFGAGDVLAGQQARAVLTLGDARSRRPIKFGLVTSASCVPQVPKCAAAQSSFADYRIASEGRASQGFQAILGISFGVSAGANSLPNPLATIASNWIVELPLPGSNEPGRLILNPGRAERSGFQIFALDDSARNWNGPLRAGIAGCVLTGSAGTRHCGVIGFDSGAQSVLVETADSRLFATIRNAGAYVFEFGEPEAGLRWPTRLPPFYFQQQNMAGGRAPLSLILGYALFEHFAIHFDADNETVGLRQR